MKLKILSAIILFYSGIISAQSVFNYEVDLTNSEENTFQVTCIPPQLIESDSIYYFTAFAPGVHQPLNFGRFVKSFHVFDVDGNLIDSHNKSMNEWKISNPEKVAVIKYVIDDTYDRQAEGNVILPMSGTAFEKDFIFINNFGLIGYFMDHKSEPIKLNLKYEQNWLAATALNSEDGHSFYAESYYHLCDSPILLGDLTFENKQIGDINVEVFAYSVNDKLQASKILELAEPVLNSAYQFVTFAPVDRYAFIMFFFPVEFAGTFMNGGALEHSYSSAYALPDVPQVLPYLPRIMAHEFMHILTPLHLRSEIIANFDYSKPTSEDIHLWLYEGVTEWTANIMQLRSGLWDLQKFGNEMSDKINYSEEIGNDWNLVKLSRDWSTPEGGKKYANIYLLGALTMTCLDIELLILTNGEKGLREVYLDMINKYGKNNPFDNDRFIDEFINAAHPELRGFFENHVLGNKPLDYKYYFNAVGYDFYPEKASGNQTPLFGLHLGEENGYIRINDFTKEYEPFGLEKGDLILEVLGIEGKNENLDSIITAKDKLNPGDKYTIKVKRGSDIHTYEGQLFQQKEYNVLKVNDSPTGEQKRLRDIWMKNRKL